MTRVPIHSPLKIVLEIKSAEFDLVGSACPGCEQSLDVMQPDAEDPGRFLGVCNGCRTWFHIEVNPVDDHVWIMSVPTRTDLNFDLELPR